MHCLICAGENNFTQFSGKYAEESVNFQEEEKRKKRKEREVIIIAI